MADLIEPANGDVPPKARVFISYSRSDTTFVDRLAKALKDEGYEAWIDRGEIADLEDWWPRIETLITRADTVVFVLSPDAVSSEVVLRELAFSARLNKRLAPIVCRRVDDRAVPEALAGINRIDFVDARFETMVKRLVQALLTNIEWIRKHTEFGEAAQRWHLAGRPGPGGLMLRPPPLDEAELWIAAQPPGAPEPTEAIRAFVAASRAAFDQEEAAQLAQIAEAEQLRGNFDTALKLSVRAARRGLDSNSAP